MNDYEIFVKNVNNIFSILEKIKESWKSSDNIDAINEINEHRKLVIKAANYLQKNSSKENNK